MLIIILQTVLFIKLDSAAATPFSQAQSKYFNDHEWFGASFHDLVMPLFLFVVGAMITTIGGCGIRYLL